MTDILERLRDPYIVLTSMVVRLEAADEIERLRDVLKAANHTLCVHGKIDANTPLHERIIATALPARGREE